MRDLIGQKPMVYYTGKPIEKGIRTTSHKQNRLLICKQWFRKAKKQNKLLQALLNIKSVGFHILLLP